MRASAAGQSHHLHPDGAVHLQFTEAAADRAHHTFSVPEGSPRGTKTRGSSTYSPVDRSRPRDASLTSSREDADKRRHGARRIARRRARGALADTAGGPGAFRRRTGQTSFGHGGQKDQAVKPKPPDAKRARQSHASKARQPGQESGTKALPADHETKPRDGDNSSQYHDAQEQLAPRRPSSSPSRRAAQRTPRGAAPPRWGPRR